MSSVASRTILRGILSELPKSRVSSVTARNEFRSLQALCPNNDNLQFYKSKWEHPIISSRAFSSTKNDRSENTDEESATSNDDETLNTEGKEEATKEVDEVELLKAEAAKYKDQLLRSLAEQENIRRIAKRDVDAAKSFSVASFAKSMLETSDNLSRAIEAVPDDVRADPEKNPVLATLLEGIQMTDDGLTKAFEKHGLKKFGGPGEKFDPNKHEALFEYPDDNMDAGSVGQVMKVGFELNGRVIRSAEVGVTKNN